MVDTLKKLREPAALVLLGALALRLLMGLVSVFVLASNDRLDSFTAAARSVAAWITDPFALVVLAGLVAACVLVDRTPRARQLTLFALVLAAAGIGLTFLFGLIGLAAEGGINRLANFLVFLADLAIPVLVAVVLLKLLQGQPAPVRQQALPSGAYGQDQYAQGQYPQGQYGQSPYGQGQAQPNPNQPTWQPDQAAGASWNTAGDAASGAAASGWGTPGESGGWNPTGPAQGGQPGAGQQGAGQQGAGQQGAGAYGVEETQQIHRGGEQPTQGGWGAPPTPWGAAPYDRSQPTQASPPSQSSQPGSAASAPADDPATADGRPEFGRRGETGSDPAAGPSQPRQDNDWWNTPRP